MDDAGSGNPHVIGLTGSFGSGCTYTAENMLARLGYEVLSLSDALREAFRDENSTEPEAPVRRRQQAFGDHLRETEGADCLARRICKRIKEESTANPSKKWVVDSIRNPAEVHCLRDFFSANFFLFGVYATRDRRWQRLQPTYEGNLKEFREDDERDTGRQSEKHGQHVEDCFAEADVVFANDVNFEALDNQLFCEYQGKVKGYVNLVAPPLKRRQPTDMECLMAAAYTISQRSSCLKRKVGAVIVDDEENVISSGFNEVPGSERPCGEKYRQCRRDRDWEKFQALLKEECPETQRNHASLLKRVRDEFRMLDLCRALHAEENAIVTLARNGRSIPLGQCKLYTTTYPCRLCANKIVNLGIKHVVYLEPYPDPAAKVILEEGGVTDQFFEGITFKAYSRVYGEKK